MGKIIEALIRHEVLMNRRSNTEAKSFDAVMNEVRQITNFVFAGVDELTTLAQVAALAEDVAKRSEPIINQYIISQQSGIVDLIDDEAIFQTKLINGNKKFINKAAEVALKKYRTTPIVIGKGNRTLNPHLELETYTKRKMDAIKKRMVGGYTQGQTPQELRKAITGVQKFGYKDGYLNKANNEMKALVRTARKQAESQTKTQVYKRNGTDGYALDVVLDSKTSDICLGYDGTIVLWDNSFQPKPPFHENCRTTMVPYFVGDKIEKGKGFEWLKGQSKELQETILGKKKALIFRNSGLTAEEYRKATRTKLNQPLTLDEIKIKNKQLDDFLA